MPELAGTPLSDGFEGDAGAWAEAFRDERKNRRASDPAFFASLLRGGCKPAGDAAALDVLLWTDAANGTDVSVAVVLGGAGPLAPLGDGVIEVWTETELSGIQALLAVARLHGREDARDRGLEAARWHVENTQPDNATNHPWALNAFVELSEREGSVEAMMYAQTLLHNALVGRGRPERFAACVLFEAAVGLEAVGL